MNKELLEIYTDYLISNTHYATATGLSDLLQQAISHDKITRFLGKEELSSKNLWTLVKPIVRKFEEYDGALVFDDTIEEKEYSSENEIICWHYSHSKNRIVKGFNILTGMVVYSGISLPVSFEIIKKEIKYCDLKTRKEKRKSSITKNEILRSMFQISLKNLKFKYVLFDNWFSSKDNLSMINDSGKIFIGGIKSNRTVAMSKKEAKAGIFKKVSEIDLEDSNPIKVYLKDVKFQIILMKKIFKNKDGSNGILYLISNEISMNGEKMYDIYQRRWNIEVYHKSIKSNSSLKKSPTKKPITQKNHIFSSIYSFVKLEILKIKSTFGHFNLRYKLILKANMAAFEELQKIKQNFLNA